MSSLPSVLRRRSLPALATFASVVAAAFAYLQFAPRLYEVTGRLMLDEKQVSISDLGRDLTKLPQGTPGGSNPSATQAELVKSQRVLNQAVKRLSKQGVAPLPSAGELRGGLKVKIVPATDILELSYQGKEPKAVAARLNAVMAAMVEENVQSTRAEARSVREFLEQEVPKQRALLRQRESAENQYRQRSGVVSAVDQTKRLVDSLASAEDQVTTLSAQLQEARARTSALQNVVNAGPLKNAYATVQVGQDEELKNLRTKLVDLETKVIDGRSRLGDKHPDLMALIEQRDSTRALYTQKLARIVPGSNPSAQANAANGALSQDLLSRLIVGEVERSALENKFAVVRAERGRLQNQLTQLPLKQQPLSTLTRQREEAEESLKFLQSKLQEARIAEAQLVSNIQVIAQAYPPSDPAWPKKPIVLVVAIAVGLALATAVVLLLELMDNTLRDASEASELLELPLLGVLPNLPSYVVNFDHTEQFLDSIPLVEPYRMLLKTLEFRSSKKLRLIVVSSTLSGEGKSIVASHLAALAAMLSKRTLIIDADLRRPTQGRLFNLPDQPGITDVIDGKVTLFQALKPTGIENLSLLTHGDLRQRPCSLLESASMKTLLAEAVEHFDLVIVDTPPVSSCVDAVTLSRQSDGLVLVTRPNFTPKETLVRAVSELKNNGAPLLGIVVNGVTTQTEQYYRYPSDYAPLANPRRRVASSRNGS